jgi:hypothetical protein
MLTLIAVLALLYGALVVMVDMAPSVGHHISRGPLYSKLCPQLDTPRRPPMVHLECTFVPADAHVPQRVAIAVGTVLVAGSLFVAAARAGRRRGDSRDAVTGVGDPELGAV